MTVEGMAGNTDGSMMGVALQRPAGRTSPVLRSLCRSKFLWLHSLFAFLYFLINFAFMGHHCLGFVPKKSLHVSV